MAQASILTLEPNRGGVPALAKTIYGLLRAQGHQPTLVYRASEEVPTGSRLAVLRYFLTTPPVRHLIAEGLPSIAVADYPLSPRYQYHLLRLAGSALHAPIAAVVSGSSHVGLPLALGRRPYVMWVATLYSEELKGRALAGDSWAAGLLKHRDWPRLAHQERLVYERASLILGLSYTTTQQISDCFPQVRAKLRTVLYPVDTHELCPGTGPAEPGYIFLSARIQDPRKNVNLLIRAFANIHQTLPNIRLIIAGDTPTADTAALTKALGLADKVEFVGHVSRPELLSLYQRASVFVLPSLQEGLGISALEAMACGVPVVSTRCGGPEGIVQDGVTGRLVPNGDEQALAAAILDLLVDPERRKAMGARGREFALQEFSRERVEAQLRAVFAEVFGALWQ